MSLIKKDKKPSAPALALCNQKGGVGKSVSTANLACCFGSMGMRVLVVDADFQGNTSSQLGIKKHAQAIEKTISAGMLRGEAASTIWLKSEFENVFVIAADQEFNDFNNQFINAAGAHLLLREWLEEARSVFDLILIDTHPSLDLTFQNVMVAADYYILPMFAEADSLEGLHIMFKKVREIKERLNPTLHILGCFITKYDKTIPTHERFLETIEVLGKKIGMPVLGSIPFSKAIPSSAETKVPVSASMRATPIKDAYFKLAKNLKPELKPARRGRTPNTPEVDRNIAVAIAKAVSAPSTLFFEEGACI